MLHLAWSTGNRSALVRIPAARGQGTRVELRSPDPACNPYLVARGLPCRGAGRHRAAALEAPPDEITENIYAMNRAERATSTTFDSLPAEPVARRSTPSMRTDELLTLDTLGKHIVSQYVEGKRREWEEYRTVVTDWEINKYIVMF